VNIADSTSIASSGGLVTIKRPAAKARGLTYGRIDDEESLKKGENPLIHFKFYAILYCVHAHKYGHHMTVSLLTILQPPRLFGSSFRFILIFFAVLIFTSDASCNQPGITPWETDAEFSTLTSEQLASWINSLTLETPLTSLQLIEPLPKTVFPPDMTSPAFRWEDSQKNSAWLITIGNGEKDLLKALVSTRWWIPDPYNWDCIRQQAGSRPLELVVLGIGGWTGRMVTSRSNIVFQFSEDRVDARILFMQKPLPFREAKKYPEKTRVLAADLASYEPPRTLLSDPPVCANCHSYSGDGRWMTLDMDFKGDKGAFLISPITNTSVIKNDQLYSWNILAPQAPAAYSMGLFARLSTKGDFIAGTVDETSVFVMMDDLFFSQLFYPATGRIGVFDTQSKTFFRLPGADLEYRVQTTPAWHPDGSTIAFSAASINPELIKKVVAKELLQEDAAQKIADLNRKYPVQFDICTIPFNDGKGGRAVPLQGASGNGLSNYFPRYSPDGKWIVFTQSPTGLVLQPDSRLMIVPAGGGPARALSCNLPIMNSWHSWSPNSKWMVFSSKSNSPFTELFLTHINDRGESSPAIRLFRLSRNDLAAMVPEFIPKTVNLPETIGFSSMENVRGRSMATDGR